VAARGTPRLPARQASTTCAASARASTTPAAAAASSASSRPRSTTLPRPPWVSVCIQGRVARVCPCWGACRRRQQARDHQPADAAACAACLQGAGCTWAGSPALGQPQRQLLGLVSTTAGRGMRPHDALAVLGGGVPQQQQAHRGASARSAVTQRPRYRGQTGSAEGRELAQQRVMRLGQAASSRAARLRLAMRMPAFCAHP